MENDNNQQKTRNAKVYKLFCDDGYFYYGSSIQKYLSTRMWSHKADSIKDKYKNNKVYTHINKIGWERVKIILVEEFPYISRDDTRRRENIHIVKDLNNPFCLNNNRSFITTDEAMDNIKKRKQRLQEISNTIMHCECGMEHTKGREQQHKNSFNHRSRIEQII